MSEIEKQGNDEVGRDNTERDARLAVADVTTAFQGKDLSDQLPSSLPAGTSFKALIMMLLPVVYFLLVFLIATGVVCQTVLNRPDFTEGLDGMGSVIVWFLPIFVGSVLVIFLLKPVLIRPSAGMESIEVTPEKEPLLFCLIEKICAVLGATPPGRVRLDCEPRVTARGGSAPKELVIGSPLVAGLTARQLAGVLARELSHYRPTRRGSAQTVRSIDAWCERLAYHRSEIDTSIDELCDSDSRLLRGFGRLTKLAMGSVREILRCLMMIGKRISHRCVQQLELDADICGACVVGAQCYNEMLMRSCLLAFSRFIANRELEQSMKHVALPRDYPGYIAARLGVLQEPLRRRFVEQAFFYGNTPFATHPTLSQRSRRIGAMDLPGVFAGEAPAAALFSNFTQLCEDATMFYYFSVWGEKFREWGLDANDEYLRNHTTLPAELLPLI
jgi:Zn-dependent protease with chaperone function